jgi:GNAT superfamily N-acetyltransferase
MEVNYSITDSVTPEEYMKLREAVGWGLFPLEEAEAGLSNSYIWCLRDNEASGRPIGIGRVIWDHGYVMYIADIIVIPEYQGNGLGRVIMEQVMDFIHEQLKPGYKFMVSLCSAKGKEEFYKKFGFIVRPNDDVGPGMHQWFANEQGC